MPDLKQARAQHDIFIEILGSKLDKQANMEAQEYTSTQYGLGLGPWLYAYALVKYADVQDLSEIEKLHARIHKLAARITYFLANGQTDQAKLVYSQITDMNRHLLGLLDELTGANPDLGQADTQLNPSGTVFKHSNWDDQIKPAVLDNCELIVSISPLSLTAEPLYNNPYTLNRLGWQHNRGRTLMDAVYPDDRELVTGLLPEMITQKGGSHEIRLWNEVTKKPFWVHWNVMVMDDPSTGLPSFLATVSQDITEQKEQQILLQQRQRTLLNAIEVAQLGTWSMDLLTQKTTFSKRHLDMFGLSEQDMSLQQAITYVVADERQRLTNTFFAALEPGSNGKFEADYSIIDARTGQKRIIHTKGQTNFDTSGKPVSISGIAQDITSDKNLQYALETQVQLRTRELDASNKNFAEANQKLLQANLLLSRSNEELNRFAYVASHDLQEPLRKIQSFSNLLETRYAGKLGDGADYLRRVQAAAKRMSVLIDDLLAFSRLTSFKQTTGTVSLTRIVNQVLNDLELAVSETSAVVTVRQLPEIQGDPVQLNQLFLNLVSNALKFRKPDVDPVIEISSKAVAGSELPDSLAPTQPAGSYYRIDVADNGIGFDQQHAGRIFQLFQRLHGRSQYSGTGIGLAICERVAVNHGGVISAVSSPGEGATFQIYIPKN